MANIPWTEGFPGTRRRPHEKRSTVYAKDPRKTTRKSKALKTHLADIDISTLSVNLGVVQVEHSGVDTDFASDTLTSIVLGYHVSGRAVLVLVTDTDLRAWAEVRACSIDVASVDGGELIPAIRGERDILNRQSYCGDRTYVDTFLAAEMLSQMSFSWTVYLRTQGPARAAMEVVKKIMA